MISPFFLITPLLAVLALPVKAEAFDPTPHKPMSLGTPADCFFTSAYALNNGIYPQDLVVVGSAFCGGDDAFPYKWRHGFWAPLDLPAGTFRGGYVESVSDEAGTELSMAFHLYEPGIGWDTWVLTNGQPLEELTLLGDLTHIDNAVISAQGNHIAGGNSNNAQNVHRAVRWTRDGAGWLAPQDIGPGRAVAITEDGSVVIGNGDNPWDWRDGSPWVWNDSPGGGSLTLLAPEARVYDITHSGSMIVGSRPKACPTAKCDFFPAPVYWVPTGGQWVMHDLQALDGVDSVAKAVAEVDGQPVIVGYGYTNQDGGILRGVAWLPNPGGGYGAPLRLETLTGNFESWAEAIDINRHGIVLGWSEVEPFAGSEQVLWNLYGGFPFKINAGLNDAWVNADAPFQGMFLTVFPDLRLMFAAWFTFDSDQPPGDMTATFGAPDQRWVTALGSYDGNRAELKAELTLGGKFNAPSPVPTQDTNYGTMSIEFSSCNAALVEYVFPGVGMSGSFAISRALESNVPLCGLLAAE